jgi:proteasome accessory factor A
MRDRSLINTRDEPHADPAKYRRFHIIVGDANLSHYATYLKVGTTALVLHALTSGAPTDRLPRLADPVGALTLVSRDPDWKWRVALAKGHETTAIDVQRAYLTWVQEFAPDLDPEWRAVWEAWKEILDDLERDPLSTVDRLDWSAKYRLIEQFRENEKLAPNDPWLQSLDLAYHLLDRSEGLYYGLLDSGTLRQPYSFKEISGYDLNPPLTTRAAIRGGCIEKFGPVVEAAQWDAVIMKDKGRRIELDLSDVFSLAQIELGRSVLAKARSPADLLSLPFAKVI